jgi:hypothetical protein
MQSHQRVEIFVATREQEIAEESFQQNLFLRLREHASVRQDFEDLLNFPIPDT